MSKQYAEEKKNWNPFLPALGSTIWQWTSTHWKKTYPSVYLFITKWIKVAHGRWKEHRITSDENIHKCRLILSANFQTEWERRRHALNFVSVRTSNLMWQLLLYSEIQLGTFRGHNDCKRNWCGGQKNHAMSQSQRRHCSSEKSAPALQTALLFLGLLI